MGMLERSWTIQLDYGEVQQFIVKGVFIFCFSVFSGNQTVMLSKEMSILTASICFSNCKQLAYCLLVTL